MICLWEALFPDDQNYFQLHQIMDLVSSIPLHGSITEIWSLPFFEKCTPKCTLFLPFSHNRVKASVHSTDLCDLRANFQIF
jgi:hypothetical protein